MLSKDLVLAVLYKVYLVSWVISWSTQCSTANDSKSYELILVPTKCWWYCTSVPCSYILCVICLLLHDKVWRYSISILMSIQAKNVKLWAGLILVSHPIVDVIFFGWYCILQTNFIIVVTSYFNTKTYTD